MRKKDNKNKNKNKLNHDNYTKKQNKTCKKQLDPRTGR